MSQVFLRTSMALITLIGLIPFPVSAKILVEQMAIFGDAGRSGRQLDQLKTSLLREEVLSLVMPGDNLYSGSYSSVWDSWKRIPNRYKKCFKITWLKNYGFIAWP